MTVDILEICRTYKIPSATTVLRIMILINLIAVTVGKKKEATLLPKKGCEASLWKEKRQAFAKERKTLRGTIAAELDCRPRPRIVI